MQGKTKPLHLSEASEARDSSLHSIRLSAALPPAIAHRIRPSAAVRLTRRLGRDGTYASRVRISHTPSPGCLRMRTCPAQS